MHYSTAGEEAMVHYRVERRGINPGQMHPAPLNTIPPNVPESNEFVVAITNHTRKQNKKGTFFVKAICAITRFSTNVAKGTTGES